MAEHTLEQQVEKLLQRPAGLVAAFDDGRYRNWLPLLEHPLAQVLPVLSLIVTALGRSPLGAAGREQLARALAGYAIRDESGSGYWAALGVGWFEQGLPLDADLVAALDKFVSTGKAEQLVRHAAFRLARRWSHATSTREQDNHAPPASDDGDDGES